MDFRKFLEMVDETSITEAKKKKESTAEKDHKAEKAGKKVTKDIEYDDKKDKKKKSLKDWFEALDKIIIKEAEQVTIEPAQTTSVIKKGTETLGTVTNPQLAQQIKQSIGKGEMSLAGSTIREDDLEEKWAGDAKVEPTGQYAGKSVAELKQMLAKLKHSGPHERGSPADKKMKQINFALRAKGGWKKGEGAAMKEEQLDEKAKEPFAIGMAAAKKAAGIKKKHAENLPKSVVKKGHEIGKKIAKKEKTDEAEIPQDGAQSSPLSHVVREAAKKKPDANKNGIPDYAEDGKGKNDLKKKKQVKESMNTLEAAYHEGKSHGLSKHGYACRYSEGTDEHRRYHEGFKEGLDECYGMGVRNDPIVGMEEMAPAATVPGMASQAMPAMEADLDEVSRGQWLKQQDAKAERSGKDSFSAFGQKFSTDDIEEAFTFESLDQQLNDLLKEDTQINEGLSVNMSQGLGGPGGEDSVSVTAQGDDAAKLLDFIKQVGLGGLGGGDKAEVVTVSDYGAPVNPNGESGVGGQEDIMALIKKMSGIAGADSSDYKPEVVHGEPAEMPHDHDHEEHAHEETCNECGMGYTAEGNCGCDENKEMVDEVETENQMAYNVAEDNPPDSGAKDSVADENAEAAEDQALAKQSQQDKTITTNEGGDGGEASEENDGDTSGAAGEGGAEDNPVEEDEKLDEWANNAGQKGTDTAFEQDIEFMTKVISGGLNKPKSTGQQTIPVLAGDKQRTNIDEELISEFKKLSGI